MGIRQAIDFAIVAESLYARMDCHHLCWVL